MNLTSSVMGKFHKNLKWFCVIWAVFKMKDGTFLSLMLKSLDVYIERMAIRGGWRPQTVLDCEIVN